MYQSKFMKGARRQGPAVILQEPAESAEGDHPGSLIAASRFFRPKPIRLSVLGGRIIEAEFASIPMARRNPLPTCLAIRPNLPARL